MHFDPSLTKKALLWFFYLLHHMYSINIYIYFNSNQQTSTLCNLLQGGPGCILGLLYNIWVNSRKFVVDKFSAVQISLQSKIK